MSEKIKTKLTTYFKSLSDVRILGQTFFAILVLLISWSGVKAIQKNYELQKQISRLEQEVEIQELQNENQRLNNLYLDTDQFLELSARRQFGLGAPGEKLLVVPKETALKYTIDIKQENETKSQKSNKPTYQKNYEAWISFFFRKSQNRLVDE
jgi:cell division protein FtsB